MPRVGKRSCPSVAVGILTGVTANILPHLSCPAKLIFQSCIHPCSALIDSGAEQSFIDEALAQKLGIPVEPLPEVLQVAALNGAPLASITHRTTDLTLSLSGNHVEQISLFLFKAPHTPLVLGYPWLKRHNPQIDWEKGRTTGWSPQCHEQCLRSATEGPPVHLHQTLPPI